MRIRDLFENTDFREFIDNEEGAINYDLAEDLSFFMNHDDDSYRRHVYPAVVKCVHGLTHKKKVDHSIFEVAAEESYKNYIKKYPIRELPDQLDSKMLEDVCRKFYEDLCKHVRDGKYKD